MDRPPIASLANVLWKSNPITLVLLVRLPLWTMIDIRLHPRNTFAPTVPKDMLDHIVKGIFFTFAT